MSAQESNESDLHEIRCANCGRLLAHAQIFVGKIYCRSKECKREVPIRFFSLSALTKSFYEQKIESNKEVARG